MDTLPQLILSSRMLKSLHFLSPAAVAAVYFVASLAHVLASKRPTPEQEKNGPGKSLRVACLALTTFVMATYVSESILLACVLPSHAATSSDDNLVFTLFSSLVWLILLFGLTDSSPSDIRPIFSAAWILALIFDAPLLILDILTPRLSGAAKIGRLFWQAVRIALLFALAGIAFGDRLKGQGERASDEEVAPLLARIESHLSTSGANNMNSNAYGTSTDDGSKNTADVKDSNEPKPGDEYADSDDEDDDNAQKGKLKKDWWVYTKAFAIFLPHLWPRNRLRLQLHFPALVICLLAVRAINVLAPLQLGIIINALRMNGGSVPWLAIGIFILLRFLDSSAGISLIESWLWMPIDRYTTEQLSAAAYDHVMNLSSDFHDSKKSGKTWRIVGRGEALSDLVYTIGFEMVPMATDLAIAVTVFWWLFGAYMAFIGATSSALFLWTTAKTIPLRTKRQREYIKAWEDEYAQMTESSLNWTTVSYFNRVGYEQDRYRQAVRTTQGKIIRYKASGFVISALRALTLQTGLMLAAMLASYQISKGNRSVGDFVVLVTYWGQLQGPLWFFASGFSRIAKSLVDAEKLLDLLSKKPTVGNSDGASEFVLKQGQVDFDRVCFSYDGRRKVTDNLSFRAEPGQTIALVGETGGGKSTILKLLFRFYDATSGNIMIDGQELRHVTLESLRANIGCVPQDPVLFNQTILQNLRYAKLDATEEEVQAACKAVALHDKIMSFTKGYSEKVGERGVKLSGGELQRMAIARAILKDPKILLLDEATSSVDSETEALIQASLKKLCAGRTTFVIAHRLSTIVHADLVMVIKNGRIIERGSHDKLMRVNGHYSKLWTRQLRLQTGEERSRSRSRSPEKTTVLVDDVTDSDIESRKGLLKRKKHENRGSEENYGASGQDGDEKKVMEPIMDAKVRGRSPRRNDKAWERFDSMRKKILSKSPRRQNEDATQERRSQSHSPTRTTLKPEAPEFVPTLQTDLRHLSRPNGTFHSVCEHPQHEHSAGNPGAGEEGYLSEAADHEKENFKSSSDPSMTRSTPALPTLPEGRMTRFGFHVPSGQGRKKTGSSNTSTMSSSTELPAPAGTS
jgi:ABC-type transport system involved in Fe-S cluster assembly fused permease/ATPase subunit